MAAVEQLATCDLVHLQRPHNENTPSFKQGISGVILQLCGITVGQWHCLCDVRMLPVHADREIADWIGYGDRDEASEGRRSQGGAGRFSKDAALL